VEEFNKDQTHLHPHSTHNSSDETQPPELTAKYATSISTFTGVCIRHYGCWRCRIWVEDPGLVTEVNTIVSLSNFHRWIFN